MIQKNHNLYPVIRQLKSWHKYKTKPLNADTIILGNKTLLRYFRQFNNTTINENTDILEYQTIDNKVPCLHLSLMLIAFHTSHSLHIKDTQEQKKHTQTFDKIFISHMHQFGEKYYATIV